MQDTGRTSETLSESSGSTFVLCTTPASLRKQLWDCHTSTQKKWTRNLRDVRPSHPTALPNAIYTLHVSYKALCQTGLA